MSEEGALVARTCPNCGRAATGRWCADCGQDNRVERLDTRGLLADFLQNVTGWESRLGSTLRGMLRSPGRLIDEYVSGKRRSFVNPVRWCLVSLALWLLAARVFGLDPLDASGFQITNSSGQHSEVVARVRGFLGRNLELLMFLALPLRALLLRWMFRRSGRNLAECMVMVLFVSGAGYLLGAVLVPLSLLELDGIEKLRPLLSIALSYWAALGFLGHARWSTLWRVLIVTLLHAIGTIVLFAAVALPWVWLFEA